MIVHGIPAFIIHGKYLMFWSKKDKIKAKGTRKSTIVKRRSKSKGRIGYYARRTGFAISIGVFFIWVGAWLWLSGAVGNMVESVKEKTIQITLDAGFAVDDILVEGRINTNIDAINAIVNTEKGDPIFAFDPYSVQKMIEKLNWVESVKVQRHLPNIISIKLHEKTPIALWKDGNTLKIIDNKGQLIIDSDIEKFKDFIIVTGKDAPEHTVELIKTLKAEPEIFAITEYAGRIGDRRWNLITKNKIKIKLPEKDMGLAIAKLAKIQRQEKLLEKDITMIDLRSPDRIIVRTTPGAVEEYKASMIKGNQI